MLWNDHQFLHIHCVFVIVHENEVGDGSRQYRLDLGFICESIALFPKGYPCAFIWNRSSHVGQMKSTTFSFGGVRSSWSEGQAGQYRFSSNHLSVIIRLFWDPLLYDNAISGLRDRSMGNDVRSMREMPSVWETTILLDPVEHGPC